MFVPSRKKFAPLRIITASLSVACLCPLWLGAQATFPVGKLDPTRYLEATASSQHTPVPEQYIWTADDAAALQPNPDRYNHAPSGVKATPHYFRYPFTLHEVPRAATLYLAGPRSAKIYVNGALVDVVSADTSSPLGMHVFVTDVSKALRDGRNVLALDIVRGRGIVSVSNSLIVRQQAFGEVLVAKIVPAPAGVNAPPLVISGPDWKSTLSDVSGWEKPDFDDSSWKPVQTLGSIEGSVDMFQWNGDAGLYDWPGYDGVSPFLRHYVLKADHVSVVFEGRSHFAHVQSLTSTGSEAEFRVTLPTSLLPDEDAPSLLLDFGREVTGRIAFQSDCDGDALVTIQYGESDLEAQAGGHYLGTELLRIPAHGAAYGPKSGFRYAKVRFLGGSEIRFKTIQLDGIYYPVEYQGAFESSDPLLNRIWETGAYTMHLCMQDDIWDAPKRDRGRWVGDLDVGGRAINSVFADHFLVEDTMTRLIGESPVDRHVNTIPGYSAMWVSALADYYRHTGRKEYLASMHTRLIDLLRLMDSGFDDRNIYVNPKKDWLFVDWAPELAGDTRESRRATQIEYYRAYVEAAYLFRELGDAANAQHFEKRARLIRQATNKYLSDQRTGTYGPRWQTNAMAILSGLATPTRYDSIWSTVLAHVEQDQSDAQVVSPYYNYYVVAAMAQAGHRSEALAWIRKYWGGMLDQGATSFWEAYDLRWPKNKFHLALQADGTAGFFVSLAHGWSSGPTAWLMEQVLGINATDAGFRHVNIRPDLIDLAWAKGSEPTPNGLLKIDVKQASFTLDLPASVSADVLVPLPQQNAKLLVNGSVTKYVPVESGTRGKINLDRLGHYEIHTLINAVAH